MRLKVLSTALAVVFAAGHANAAERQDVAAAAATEFAARAAKLGFDQISYGADGRVNAILAPVGNAAKGGSAALKSSATVQRARGADDVAALFQRDLGTLIGLRADNAMRVNDVNVAADGRAYYRGDQTYRGLVVWGGGLTVQTDASGKVEAVLGSAVGVQNLDIVPRIDSRAAVNNATFAALQLDGLVGPAQRVPVPKIVSEPELVVYAADGHVPTLAWAAEVRAGTLSARVYADANTGDLINRCTNRHDLLDRRIYDAKGACLTLEGSENVGMLLEPYAQLVPALTEGGDPSTQDASIQRAYHTIGQAYYFFHNALGIDSFDNAGSPINAYVRASVKKLKSSTCSANYDNAAFASDDTGSGMLFGNGTTLGDSTKGADVTYHELGHGVTGATSKLAYQKESGGLNEANSDIYAAAAQAWMNTVTGEPDASTPVAYQLNAAVWTIGEKLDYGVLRTMGDPAAKGNLDHYNQYTSNYSSCTPSSDNDNCGVHTSSGISNLAFFLLTNAGKHPRGKTTTVVNRIPMERAIRYLYEANALVLTQNATFSDMRNAMQTRARAGGKLCDEVQIANAWTAVGVTGAAPQDANACIAENLPPVAAFTLSANGRTVSVDGSTSSDPEGVVSTYTWDFGDGTTGTGAKTSRKYAANGSYTVKLTATDNYGVTNSATQTISVLAMTDSQCKGPITIGNFAAANETQYSPTYTTTGTYSHVICVEGPAGSDFDLYLEQQNGATWKQVTSSTGTASAKRLSSTQFSGGTYRVRLVSTKGSGQYYLTVAKP